MKNSKTFKQKIKFKIGTIKDYNKLVNNKMPISLNSIDLLNYYIGHLIDLKNIYKEELAKMEKLSVGFIKICKNEELKNE